MKARNPGIVMQLGPPWSTTVVTPDCTPTMSALRPNLPVTCSYTWPWVSISPGRTVSPGRSMRSQSWGIGVEAAGPTASMRLPRTMTTPSAMGSRPVPSMMAAAVIVVLA